MRFTILPSVLKTALSAVKSVIPATTAMPVLSNVLFRPSEDGESFFIVASDGDTTIEYPLSIDEHDHLTPFLAPANMLNEYLRSVCTELPLVFEVSAREISISDIFCEGFEGAFKFAATSDPAEYPVQRPLDEGYKHFVLPSEPWCDAIASARSYCSNDELRPVMNGVYADFQPGMVTIAASDSKKLFRENIRMDDNSIAGNDRYGVILPKKLVALATGIIDRACPLSLDCDGKVIRIEQQGIVIYARCIEGRFPRYEAVIPRANHRVAVINRQQLISAIKRIMIASPKHNQCVAFDFDGSVALKLEAQDVDFSTYSNLRIPTIEQHDSVIRIGMNGKFLQEVLESFKRSERIRICMSEPSRAVTIVSTDSDDRLSLLMPLQLTDF